ncbi:MAG: F0F1 ATP synthase subunit gamma [Kiritimatiellae bacterium]|nr:F0F1 ATP synthase subunit gamma [Kiritimatiellia bacterium]MDD5521931.1 F0F1 ATP synthase subunit gamma [Kiritimatiellia bacterium]
MQLNELRKELKFNKELLNLVETLKDVAGSQYHLMEKEKERFGPFMEAFSGFFRVVNLVDVDDPFVRVMSDILGIVIITSDSGFMGGLNQGVIRAAFGAQGDLPNDKVSLIVIGEKGGNLIGDMKRSFKYFGGINQTTIYEQALEVKDYLVTEVLAKRMGKVIIAYPKPISFTAQTIEVINILPCAELFDRNSGNEISGKINEKGLIAEAGKVVVESSFSDMTEYLSSVWVATKLYEVFEDSKLAEFSARAMHLEGSHQKVSKEYKKIKQQCSKAGHELIDKGMRESFAAKGGKAKKKRRKAIHDAAQNAA